MMREWISALGIYLLPMVILVIEVFIGILLMASHTLVRFQKKGAVKDASGERLYYRMISEAQQELHLLIRHEDRSFVFATKNIEEILKIDPERIRGNIRCLTENMNKSDSRVFWEEFGRWNRKKALEMQYFDTIQQRWFRISVSGCPDEAYDLFVVSDISGEKARAEEIEKKLEEAESISQSKTTFLSRMSHEIRTPMNGIRGMLTLIGSQPHNEVISQYLEKANNLSDYLLSLINDILDMSRIENGKLELECCPFDLFDVAAELRAMFQKTVEAGGVKFIVETLDMKHHCVKGDRLRLTQVLVNFISNAVKFTSEGEIRVTFREMMHGDGKLNFMVRVHDTGVGMEPQFVSRIFRPFEQENAGIAKKYGGSGLGMAITDQIVRLMGGEIVIDTMPQQGSDFTVYLSMPIADEAEISRKDDFAAGNEKEAYTFKNVHILMAEDNEINAEIAEAILKEKGAFIEIVGDGQEAVDRFVSQPEGTYDLILMDIQMPVLDGRAAARKIRAFDRADAKTIPIFALSADAFVEDQRLSTEAGMNGHFAKPIDFDMLEQGVGVYMRKKGKVHK